MTSKPETMSAPSSRRVQHFWQSAVTTGDIGGRMVIGRIPESAHVHQAIDPHIHDTSWGVDLLLLQSRDDRDRIAVLEREVERLKEAVGLDAIEIRDVSRARAKKEIRAYFESHHGETIYPSDVATGLCLDYELVCTLIATLEAEGAIAKVT